ncbi:E3 ubiquitin-protein ligase RBBP6-like isoform X2 [Myripristis murdjan]|uniref:E3 ubiquitin-protein ligase RBBP6-like isoform X2 n=1 Tax=Myripristis murdjan TaxID=586833 RepID=UPI001175F16B|nr:E3 ubiquitin-protein ligase RBBP6 isoform X2 [Myripristis murdjan]
MAHVHYKFSSKLKSDTVVFDGLYITLKELKRQIMGREKLRAGDCDLQITNSQTKEEYTDDDALIAKNSSVIIRRIPVGGVRASNSKTNIIERSDHQLHHHYAFGASKAMDEQSASRAVALLSKTANLADADASEEDKIRAMMSQSNHGYDPAHYIKKHGPPPPANYTCYRCGKNGHHIRNCPTNGDKNYEAIPRIKKSTGIPRSFMVEVDDPSMKGAMLTSSGRYAIPTIDAEAYALGKKERPPFVPQQQPESEDEEEQAPDELLCLICKDLLNDAVVIPCCGNSYCDDCIRTALLESEEHVCPTCSQSDVSPDALIANKFLRQAVNNYKNEQGYTRNPKKVASATHSQTPTPTPSPAPTPPLPVTQPRPQRPYQPPRSQQDPLLARPPASDTPPLAQPAVTPPTATGPASTYSTPCASPQPPQNQMETPSKEAGGETPVEAVAAAAPSVLVSTTEPAAAPSPLMPTVYHVPLAGQAQSNPPQTSSGPAAGHTGPSPDWESSSSPSGHGWTRSDTQQSPPSSSSSSSAAPAPPAPPAPPIYPSLSLFSSHFPPYPTGQQPLAPYLPTYPLAPLWPPPVLPGAPIPPLCSSSLSSSTSSSSSSIPALIPKEMYRHQRRVKESPPSRVLGRARQKSKLDEMTNDFAKELLEYRKFQRERRRSYSRSPYRGSSHSRSSSGSYSKSYSRSRSSRSYSRSLSRSRSRSHSRGRSRSRSRPRSPYSCHKDPPTRLHSRSSRSSGYRRSRSHTPSSSSSHRGGYRSRSRTPTERRKTHHDGKRSTRSDHKHQRRGDQRSSSGRSHRSVEGKSDGHTSQGGNQTSAMPTDRERYRQWEREYREWYERYFSSYANQFHSLPPLLPTPPPPHKEERRTNSSHSSHSNSRYRPHHRGDRRESRSPPSQSSNDSPSPCEDTTRPMTYQQRCTEKYGRMSLNLRTARKQPGWPRRSEGHEQPVTRDSGDPGAPKHGKQTRVWKEERGGRGGEKSSSLSVSTDNSHKKVRSNTAEPNTSSDSTPLHDEPVAGDELDSVPPSHGPDKSSGKDDEGKMEREGGREDGCRDPGSKQGREIEVKVKPFRDADREMDRYSEGSKVPESRSDKNRKKKEEERDRKEKGGNLSDEMHHSKSVKMEFTENDKAGKSTSPKPLDEEKQQKEKRKAWGRVQPLSKEMWEAGMTLKPQKKISININLDGRRKEQTHNVEFGELERTVMKEKEKNKADEREEASESRGEKDVRANEGRESSREEEAVFEEKTNVDEGEGGEMRVRASVREDEGQTWEKNLGEEEVFEDEKEDREQDDFDLWQSALGGAKEEEEEMKKQKGETEEEREKRRTGEEGVTKEERKRTRRGEEEDGVKDSRGQKTRELVAKAHKEMEGEERRGKEDRKEEAEESKPKEELMEGAKRRRMCEEEEEMARSQPQRSKSRSRHRLPDRPNTTVEFASTSYVGSWGGVSSEERQDRRMVVKTLEEYTQHRATTAEDEMVFIQVPLSKWERDESDEEEQEEGEIKVQAGTPPVPVPPPSVSMTTEIPTNSEREQEREGKRHRETEREKEKERDRSREMEREKNATLSQPNRNVASSSGKDRYDRTSPADREREKERQQRREKERVRDREQERERERARRREREREEERQGDRARGKGREREERSRASLPHSSSSTGSSSSCPSERERRDSGDKRARNQERRERERRSDAGSERSSYSSSSRSSSRPSSSSCRSDDSKLSSGSRGSSLTAAAAEFELPDQNANKTHTDKLADLKQKDRREHHDPRQRHRHSDRPADTHHPLHSSPPSPSSSLGQERDPLPHKSPREPQDVSELSKPRASSPRWDSLWPGLPSLVPQPAQKEVARRGAAERDTPMVKVLSFSQDIQQDPWATSGVNSTQHPGRPTEPPSPDRDRARSSETKREGEREKREGNGVRGREGRGGNPERQQDKAVFMPDYSESEEEEGKRSRDVVNEMIKEREGEGDDRRVKAERDGNSQWGEEAEKWPRIREMEEGERPSSPSSSITSSTSQEDARRDGKKREKKEKKHKKHKKHKKEKRQGILELEEGELKKHKHKKKKSKKSKEEEESSRGDDDRCKEEGEEAKDDQICGGIL